MCSSDLASVMGASKSRGIVEAAAVEEDGPPKVTARVEGSFSGDKTGRSSIRNIGRGSFGEVGAEGSGAVYVSVFAKDEAARSTSFSFFRLLNVPGFLLKRIKGR